MQSVSDWPQNSQGYELENPIGYGAFGVVYSAITLSGPHQNKRVAIKTIDLEQFPDQNIEELRKEIQIMRLCSHPNVISYHVCFISGKYFWMVMPLLEGGSVGNILKHKFPGGVKDEVLVASILKEVLQGLNYFHQNHQIHRDIKSSNILMSSEGNVFLGDFGVAAKLKEGVNAKTFAGSPCWMAPEVIDNENSQGYDYKADIWSFGITAIELVKGKPPLADYPPMKVIIMAISKDPPQLSKSDHYDSAFKEIVNLCLQKDPSRRPTAEALLRKKYFNKAKGSEYIRRHLLEYLPPLETRLPAPRAFEEFDDSQNLSSSGSGGWDFHLSGEFKAKKQEDPLEMIGTDEEDPLESICEDDD